MKGQDRGTFGDLYGSINALFSGLALLGVIAAIMLQQKELTLSTKELRNSANALRKQVELSADAARVQVLPGLIQMQKVRIKTIGGSDFKNFEGFDYSDDMITKLLDKYRAEIKEGLEAAKKAEKSFEKPMDTHIHERARLELHNLKDATAGLRRIVPELELLLRYQKDLIQIYQKIASTKLDPVSS